MTAEFVDDIAELTLCTINTTPGQNPDRGRSGAAQDPAGFARGYAPGQQSCLDICFLIISPAEQPESGASPTGVSRKESIVLLCPLCAFLLHHNPHNAF